MGYLPEGHKLFKTIYISFISLITKYSCLGKKVPNKYLLKKYYISIFK